MLFFFFILQFIGNIEFSSKSEDEQQFTSNPDILS